MKQKTILCLISLLFIIVFAILIQDNTSAQPVGWSDDIRLSVDDGEEDNYPSIVHLGKVIHVVWANQRHYFPSNAPEIYYKNSTDGGKTWNPERRLTFIESLKLDPELAVYGSSIHIVWIDDRDASPGNKIYYMNSTDGGNTWSAERRISPVDSDGWNVDLAVNGSNVHVVYTDAEGSSNERLFYTNSTDNGKTWSSPKRLTDPSDEVWGLFIDVYQKNIHILWSGLGNPMGVYYLNSTNNGINWSDEQYLKGPQAGSGDIAVNGSFIHVIYGYDTGIADVQLFYRRSSDNGTTWEDDIQLTDSPDLGSADLAVYKNKVLISWVDKTIDNSIFFIVSEDNGENWSEEVRLTFNPAYKGGQDFSLNEEIHVVWVDKRDGVQEVYYKRNNVFADLSITSENITFSNNIPNIGMPIEINATIQNIGDENVTTTIEFWDGNPDNDGVFINSTDVTVNITESVNATINWIPAINGTRNIYIKIMNTLETNLSNNIANKSVLVNREPELGNIPSTYTLSENSIENQLINLSDYAKDDLDSWDELSFAIIGYSNSSIVSVLIFDGHFLSVDALTGPANDNWTGTIEIVIEVTDTLDLTNISNQFTVTVTEVNDAPIVINPILNFSVEEDTSDSTTVNLTNVFFDLDNSSLYYTYSGNTNINIIIHGNGSVTFTPLENWTGEETIIFYATDNLTSPTFDSVTVTITPINDAPIVIGAILDFNIDEDALDSSTVNLTDIFYDVDNATLYYSFSGNNNISVIIHENRSVTFIPAENWSGIETITFYATDNLTDPISEDVTITVIPINDPPVVINPISDFSMFEDTINSTAVDLTEVFFDCDNVSLRYFCIHRNISVFISNNGTVVFIPPENWTGIETITFYATDNLTPLISEDVTITVIGINDPPIITVLSPLNNSNHLTSDMLYFNITVLDVDSYTFTYLWDFDDGTTSTLKNATHQFSEAGIYNVIITVSDDSASDTRIVTIVVEPATVDDGENGFNISEYFWIIILIIIVVVLVFFFIWRKFKVQKDDSKIENSFPEDKGKSK